MFSFAIRAPLIYMDTCIRGRSQKGVSDATVVFSACQQRTLPRRFLKEISSAITTLFQAAKWMQFKVFSFPDLVSEPLGRTHLQG
jgi:hypothetical protein